MYSFFFFLTLSNFWFRLENIQGDWHEFESKALRKEKDREARKEKENKDKEKRKAVSQDDEREAKRPRQETEDAEHR